MQTSSIALTAREYILGSLVGLLGALTGVLALLLKRRESNANARKTDAETRQIDVSTIETLIKSAGIQAARAERVADERDHYKRKAQEWEDRCGERDAELDLLRLQMSKRVSVNPQLPPFEGD